MRITRLIKPAFLWLLMSVLAGCMFVPIPIPVSRIQLPEASKQSTNQHSSETPPHSATEVSAPLLRLLDFVPDTEENRKYVSFGDSAAWHKSWDVPRIDSVEELDKLDRDARAYWLFIHARQTAPAHALGIEYVLAEDQRNFYGFDIFNLDRYLEAGEPPSITTVAEFDFESQQIADALLASGYEAQALDDNTTLFSILGDYEFKPDLPIRTGQLGNLNRIALSDGHMVIAKATEIIDASVSAQAQNRTLADDATFLAAAQSLDDASLAETGDLVGMILMADPAMLTSAWYLPPNTDAQLLERLRNQSQETLPPYQLAGFATRHRKGTTSLILTLVFPTGINAADATNVLEERLKNYISIATNQPMNERWTFERALATQANGLPVALAILRVDDPPVAPEGERANTTLFTWSRMIFQRDLAFLVVE